MASSRMLSNRRLCYRYKYFFYVAVLILALQGLLGYNFYSMKVEDQSSERATDNKAPHDTPTFKKHPQSPDKGKNPGSSSNDKLNIENGGKGPPANYDVDNASNNNANNPNNDDSDMVPADQAKEGEGDGEGGPKRVLRYEPHCEIQNREAVSAITRARTVQCKQELADVTCLHLANKLYPTRLPRTCPFKGKDEGQYLGCFKDKINDRDMESSYVDLQENGPDICINNCIRAGLNYAALQFGKECWCGDSYGRHGRLAEEHCNSPCVGNASNTCGGYLAARVFATGYGKIEQKLAPLPDRKGQPAADPVKIVFMLTLNGRQIRQVVRLLRAIYQEHHYYYIHVDSRQDFLFRELLPLEKRLKNVLLTRRRFATIWGGASLLQAHLSFIKELLEKKDWQWDYYINLSESDYPIKSVSELTNYLTTFKGLNFFKSHGKDTPRFIKKQGLDQTFYECEHHLWRIGQRSLPNGIRMDGGSDWVCLHRDFAQYIVTEKNELLLGLQAMYKYTLLPAESFFHTVLQNSRFCGQSADNNLHLTNWRRKLGCKCQYKHIVDWCGCSPNDFKISDLERIMKYEEKPVFFARKFEAVVNQDIINSLDVYLFSHLQQGLAGLASYWQNEFHHLDSPPKNRDTQLTFYHSFSRLALQSLAQHGAHCVFTDLQLLEVNLFQEDDNFRGLLALVRAQHPSSGRQVTLETHFHPKQYYSVSDPQGLVPRLQFLEVGSDFDPKELIFRNYGRLLGPYDDLSLRHEWNSGKELIVSVAWIDPTNVIAASYDISIPGSSFIASHKPALNHPLRPGVWTVKMMYNLKVVAETQFLVSPLSFHQGSPISAVKAQLFHSGPVGLYTSKDFSGLRDALKVPSNSILETEAAANSRKAGAELEAWIDSLVPLFWLAKETCSLEMPDSCNIKDCRQMAWSSRSPDPKSDILTIGSKLAFGR